MYISDREAKELIIYIGRKMSASGFVSANDGNITMRVDDDAIWITPTGVNKGDLREEMLSKLRISDGSVIEGTWKTSCETGMHLNVYRADNSIVSTAHAHPINLSVLACAGIELDLATTPSAFCGAARVPVIPYRCSGSRELAGLISPYVSKYHCVNLGNHGPIAWGKAPMEAWYRLENAEASAHLALELARLGRFRPLNREQVLEALEFHHIDITPEATVQLVDSNANQEPAIKFSEFMFNMASDK